MAYISGLPTAQRMKCAEDLGQRVKSIRIRNNNLYFDDTYIGELIRFESDGYSKITVEYEIDKGHTHVIEMIKEL